MLDKEKLIQAVLSGGATKAEVIGQEQIITSKAFWDICAGNGCGSFGKYWTCPPAIGEPDALIAEIKTYSHAVLYQTIGEIEDSFDIEGMGEVGKNHKVTSRKVDEAIRPVMGDMRFLHLSNGGCDLCARCAKEENKPCRFPDKILKPMEGYCIDVYKTTKTTGLKYINGANTVTYFGIILFGETENG